MQTRRPNWLRVKLPGSEKYYRLKDILRTANLHTVCEEAVCPNIGECFGQGTATFLILGDVCTRKCNFCAVSKGKPTVLDEEEPEKIARAVEQIGLRHVVITSVTRDDLPDGGASHYAKTIKIIRTRNPICTIEVLIPDFEGSIEALEIVLKECPDILNHNLETVPRLYPDVRPQAEYERSLNLLEKAKEIYPDSTTKSGLILGLGEEYDEIIDVMKDLREVDCDILTIGQYLSPAKEHTPINRFYHPDEFKHLKYEGEKMGFKHVESDPMVRSSYHAAEQFKFV
ncbi:MAG: lipoic acid synthetase [Candidatus Scalindua rubra]|uniref:Lipoyl synthase n=1 Tax=Candidatus Scalindua rubra TaxID=1872076 RepID=A0A1E3X6T0_9BACT|nr:MAG: lipoic acid synthetase [Candidatus Scalindua rubra]